MLAMRETCINYNAISAYSGNNIFREKIYLTCRSGSVLIKLELDFDFCLSISSPIPSFIS